jgi:dUTP pyrophosphatase
MKMKIKKFTKDATIPKKAYSLDLAYDLFSNEEVLLEPKKYKVIPTGIGIQMDNNYGCMIKDRSSLGIKGIHVLAGIIDAKYIGEILVTLINLSDIECIINKGDKIAQFIPIPTVTFDEIEEVHDFDETERNNKGFGSSGK